MRSIRKYNINNKENTYHLYIRTGIVKTYLFVRTTPEGKLIDFKESKPINGFDGSKKQSWNTLFPEIKEYQFNKVFPYGTSKREKLVFLYGEKETENIFKYESWLQNQTFFPEEVAWKIYEKIGKFEKVKIIRKSKDRIIAKIENKWIVSINLNCNKYYIYHNKNDKYNKKIKQISEKMNIPLEFAAIVRFLKEDKSYEVLGRMINLSSKKALMNHINAYVKNMRERNNTLVHIEEKEIKRFLKDEFGSKTYQNLELPRENLFSWASYLNKNS